MDHCHQCCLMFVQFLAWLGLDLPRHVLGMAQKLACLSCLEAKQVAKGRGCSVPVGLGTEDRPKPGSCPDPGVP